MTNQFFEQPILNSPYEHPARHWELDADGQPTEAIIDKRRRADFITPIAKPRRRRGAAGDQGDLIFNEGLGLSTDEQAYDHTAIINAVREQVDAWRRLPASGWRVTPETARLLAHWRHHEFSGIRPFFCQVLEIRFPRVAGYRVELPEERLTAKFTADSVFELTPDIVGPSITKSAGIIGEAVDMSLEHIQDMRRSTLLYHITQRLLTTQWRDPGEQPKFHLFGQLKRITNEWLDTCLVCKGGTYPGLLMYQVLADVACDRITAAITRAEQGQRPIKAVLDPYNPVGSTNHVNFNTSKMDRWDTIGPPPKCQLNWVILDSDWEGEFCRVAEAHPRVLAYVKNHNLGFEVPYRYASETRRYRPDFIIKVDDGHGADDPLNLVVEIKGYRGEDAKEKKSTMDTYWVPGVNNLQSHGRWAFAEFTDVFQIQDDFAKKVEAEFNKMITMATTGPDA